MSPAPQRSPRTAAARLSAGGVLKHLGILALAVASGAALAQSLIPALPMASAKAVHALVTGGTDATVALGVALDGRGSTPAATNTPTVTPTAQPTISIAQIQGAGVLSPLVGQIVTTGGIVTARKTNGFFLQMPSPGDGDAATSDGVFVFTSSSPPAAAAVGNLVQVRGTVQEFRPSADLASPPATELVSPMVTLLASGQSLPAAVVLTAVDTDPNGPIEQLERLEGMRVHVDQLRVIAPTSASITESTAKAVSTGAFYAVIPGIARPFREAGIEAPEPIPPPTTPQPCCPPRFDGNPERLAVDSNGQVGATALDVTTGATVTNVTGPLDYLFRTYTILPDPLPVPPVTGNRTFTPVPIAAPDELTVASFNIERFFDDVDDPGVGDPVLTTTAYNNRLNKASLAIRNVLRNPDVIGLQEVENINALQALATKINNDTVSGGDSDPAYQAQLLEGNDVGGIDVGFLVKSTRVTVDNVVPENKDETYINPNTGLPETLNDRPPLRLNAHIAKPGGGTFVFTVIVVHQRSLGGNNADVLQPGDPNAVKDARRVRAKRAAQAESLARLAQARQALGEDLLVLGDYNALEVNDGYVDVLGTVRGQPAPPGNVVVSSPDLVDPDLVDLIDLVTPPDQKYSYAFGGNAQVLDHIVVDQSLLPRINRVHYGRVDADFPVVYYADPSRPERLSDHDPPVAYIRLGDLTATPTPTEAPSPTPTATPPAAPLPGQSGSGRLVLAALLLAAAVGLRRATRAAASGVSGTPS